MSVNEDTETFLKVLNELNKYYNSDVKQSMCQRPYFLYLFFLEAMNGSISLDLLQRVQEDDLHLSFKQAIEVCRSIDPQLENGFMSLIEDKDTQTKGLIQQLKETF
jgi:hypothetical protein